VIEIGTEVTELTDDHRDGTIWVDVSGDLWTPAPWGWSYTRQVPFYIHNGAAHPGPTYGPYRAVIGPPEEHHHG
jgi:hypothetical protein